MREEFHSIRWPLAIDPLAGTVADEPEYARHIDQLIKHLLLTNPGERIHRPDFGCGLRRMVFSPNNPAAASLAKISVLQALEKWLGTVITVEDLTITARDERLEVSVRYILRVRQERRYLNVEVAL